MTGATTTHAWREVRGKCPVCGRRGWCRTSSDGELIACRRQDRGAIKRLDYADGSQAWLHAPNGRRCQGPTPQLPPARPAAPRAVDADLDRVYRALLAAPELVLRPQHRQHLTARGLGPEDLARETYRTLPAVCRAGIVRRLLDRFAPELLLTVPGVIARDGPHGRYPTLAGRAGVIIPVRSTEGLIVGLVVRPDQQEPGKKYVWISSAYHGGPSPGSRCHIPAGVVAGEHGVLVEGILKANVTFALSRRTAAVVGLPGPYTTPEAIDALKSLGVRQPLLALDADARKNPSVANAQLEGLRLLNRSGFDAGLVRWDEALGKGLDDALLAMRKGTV